MPRAVDAASQVGLLRHDLLDELGKIHRREVERLKLPFGEAAALVHGEAELGATLAIDELGVQAGSESEHGLLHAVIDARLRARRPTLCGTNLSAQELPGAIGERALDRLRQVCRMVVIDGESFRRNRRVCIELG